MQGVTSFQDEATPIWGFSKSSSVKPTARSIDRAGARSAPSVTSRLLGRIRSLFTPTSSQRRATVYGRARRA